MNWGEYGHWALHLGELYALYMIGRDTMQIAKVVDAAVLDEEQMHAEERKLQAQEDQLREELDQVQIDLRALKKDVGWCDNRRRTEALPQLRETLEGAFAPPRQPNDTEVFSPNTPKLPQWTSCPACGLQSEHCICGGFR